MLCGEEFYFFYFKFYNSQRHQNGFLFVNKMMFKKMRFIICKYAETQSSMKVPLFLIFNKNEIECLYQNKNSIHVPWVMTHTMSAFELEF